jgi:hypothetical protein
MTTLWRNRNGDLALLTELGSLLMLRINGRTVAWGHSCDELNLLGWRVA